jgi:hypothetical protein
MCAGAGSSISKFSALGYILVRYWFVFSGNYSPGIIVLKAVGLHGASTDKYGSVKVDTILFYLIELSSLASLESEEEIAYSPSNPDAWLAAGVC